MIQTSTITQKGQVTIPSFIRQKMALETGSKVLFNLENEKIILSPLPSFFDFRGSVKSHRQFNIKKMRQQAKEQLTAKYGKNS
jgi:AbrB family looped-hinge helix DNA binding protein